MAAFLEYERHAEGQHPVTEEIKPQHSPILVVDILTRSAPSYPIVDGVGLTTTMASHGVIAAAPLHPECGFTIRILELFMVLSSHCASLSIQAFVRSICNLQRIAYRPLYRKQFSVAFDVFLKIHRVVDEQLDSAIYHDPLSALRAACPACTYRLKNEPALRFSTLTCMDGNNSVKRVLRTAVEDAPGATPYSVELPDSRTEHSALFLERDVVNKLQDEVKRKAVGKGKISAAHDGQQPDKQVEQDKGGSEDTSGGSPIDGLDEDTPCTTRWANLASDSLKKMWGIYDETGIFIGTCRHGMVFAMCDMVRSGEL